MNTIRTLARQRANDGRDRTVFLLGPLSPANHGTSVPFGHLVRFVSRHCRTYVLDSHQGGVPLRNIRVSAALIEVVRLVGKSLWFGLRADVCIVYASQRFAAIMGAPLSVLLGWILRRRVIIYIPGGAFDTYMDRLHPAAREVVKWSFAGADKVVVQTRLSYDRLAAAFGKLAMIPNWVDTSLAPPACAQERDEVRLLYVGEVRKEKGVIELLKAFHRFVLDGSHRPPRCSLTLIGRVFDDVIPEFEELLRATNGQVTHRSHVSHLDYLQMLSRSHVLVLASYLPTEGHPGVVLEALSLGIPVVATKWRSIPELVRHEGNGILVEPGDVAALADGIERIAGDYALRVRLGRQAKIDGAKYHVEAVLRDLWRLANSNGCERS